MITVIIPTLNEGKYISGFLDNLLAQDMDSSELEIVISDGGSTDNTKEIIYTYLDKFKHIFLIDNPDKFVPHALNRALKISKGEIIVRMDAHALYPENYISTLAGKLNELNAGNVGGVWVTKPGDKTLEASAIAIATSDKIGIGNSSYRHGAEKILETDTVPYGCFNRDIFELIGYFDEDLLRNQDDELNGRIIKFGKKIYLIPDLKIIYFSRPNRQKMRKMFFQYGLFKPLVMIKLGAPATIRQFAPPLLVIWHLIAFFSLPFVNGQINIFAFAPLILYYLLICVRSAIIASSPPEFAQSFPKLKLFFSVFITFPQIHFSYGIGYVKGWIDFVLLRKHKRKVKILE